MTDVLDRLRNALADRHTIEREIGSGGVATVYHAQELKQERQGADKVLRPALSAELGTEGARPLYGPGDLQFRIWMKRPESVTR